jgi:hypothetical protein
MYWLMPEWELGKPTGLAVGDDGNLYVADTHYFRVMAFDPHGNEVLRFGRFGQGPGEGSVKRYTDGHIHKMSAWSALSTFIRYMFKEWTRIEQEALKRENGR